MVATTKDTGSFQIPPMSDRLFRQFRKLIFEHTGIHLADGKKTMVASRIIKRLRRLSLKSFNEYYLFLQDGHSFDQELTLLIDAITTNKTEFFREHEHFQILVNNVLPALHHDQVWQQYDGLRIWSAGCSTGEEPYTLSMVLADEPSVAKSGYSILATDISMEVLQTATRAVYSKSLVQQIPPNFRFKYMMAGKGDYKGYFRVLPEIRSKVRFGQLNLMDRSFGIQKKMHIIFCRNVIIYFNLETKRELIRKFYHQLLPGGYLFLGHSESLSNVNSDFKTVAPTVYRKPF